MASGHEWADHEDMVFAGIQNIGKPTQPAKLFAALRGLVH
jgi:hypothetical protein